MPNEKNRAVRGDGTGYSGRVPLLPDWALRLLGALASAIGLSGLLYCAGFLALRSQQTFWGFWSGPSDDAADMVAEGGRFLYNLASALIDLLDPSSGASAGFYALVITGISVWALPVESLRSFFASRLWLPRVLHATIPLATALLAYVLGIRLMDDLKTVMKPSGLLTNKQVISPRLTEFLCEPANAYFGQIQQWIVLAVVCGITVWALRLGGNLLARIVVWISGLLLIAATSLLPAVYGRLVLLPNYPQIAFTNDQDKTVERVLIRSTDSQWVVWNLTLHKTEVIGHRDTDVVTIGARPPLASLTGSDFPGGFCVKK